jgi:hypothetical protein
MLHTRVAVAGFVRSLLLVLVMLAAGCHVWLVLNGLGSWWGCAHALLDWVGWL